MNPESHSTSKKQSNITIGTGIKLGIGISIGILIVLLGLAAVGVFLFQSTVHSPIPAETKSDPAQREDQSAEFTSLSQEEKLEKRLAGVDAANKNVSESGLVMTLTGPNRDIITVTSPLSHYPKHVARDAATSFIDGFLRDEQTIKEMIALEVKAVTVTDGKRSWTRDLKTGTFTEHEIK